MHLKKKKDNKIKLTIHLTRTSVADIALTVTFQGGCAGGACIVWNSLVESEAFEGPTTFTAMMRNLYTENGTKWFTVNVTASGFDSSNTGNQVVFRAVWAYNEFK